MSGGLAGITREFQQLELRKKEIMEILSALPQELYARNPNPGTWSPAQVANHLYRSEKLSLAYLKKKLSYPDSVPKYHPRSWLGIGLIRFVYVTGYKIKAPEMIDMWKIQEVLGLEELNEQWTALRKEMFLFIEANFPAFGSHLAFRHPFAGRMTFYQMLLFFNTHVHHHQRQLKRILLQLHA